MEKSTSSNGGVQKWTSLFHNGVILPEPYKPHGVKMLYNGSPVDLSPEEEEVATLYAEMLDLDHYMKNSKFKDNFMGDWRKILGPDHIIQSLEYCDFTPIYQWRQRETEKKIRMTIEERKDLQETKMKLEEKHMWAIVDGAKEKVENFRVGPPGLFRGRGQNTKSGKLKRRIRPSDITINIGEDAPIPVCPFPGESWKNVVHDNTVTWLACWKDPICGFKKYAFMPGLEEKAEYERAARLLKNHVQGIRAAYTNDFTSDDMAKRQIAVATYFIDKLSLRAGDEKGYNYVGDTVACCTLKVEELEPVPPNILKFDYISKDSTRYQNDVEVETAVFEAIQQFRNGKNSGDYLFDKLDLSTLNAHLESLMPGLTDTVFRRFNASVTMDDILSRVTLKGVNDAVPDVYSLARNRVETICNLKRTIVRKLGVDKSSQMKNLRKRIEELKIDGMEWEEETKKELMRNTFVISTSKVSDIDPRILVAWCKLNEVPVEKLLNKYILARCAWAVDVDPGFRF